MLLALLLYIAVGLVVIMALDGVLSDFEHRWEAWSQVIRVSIFFLWPIAIVVAALLIVGVVMPYGIYTMAQSRQKQD